MFTYKKSLLMLDMHPPLMRITTLNYILGKKYIKYTNYLNFYRNKCKDGCPQGSHCEWGICECDSEKQKMFGQCSNIKSSVEPGQGHKNPFKKCSMSRDCWDVDINLVCTDEKCGCRHNMKWNKVMVECQVIKIV